MASNQPFRILALDGGGIRGLITARILQDVETTIQKTTGQTINQYFDLIAGTSTGSILAAGLVLGMKPADLVTVYQNRGLEIFPASPQQWLRKNLLSWVYEAKYSNQGLQNVLQTEFQKQVAKVGLPSTYNIKFGEIHQRIFDDTERSQRARLLILAHNTLQRQTTFFVSPSVDTPEPWYAERDLWEVCLSSASAPTFFPPYCFNNAGIAVMGQKDSKNHTYIDGGVGANTPSLAAMVHAIDIEKKSLNEIAVLSIGTGRTTAPYECQQIQKWGSLGWVNALADVFMGSQIQISADLCGQLLRSSTHSNPRRNYLRLQFPLNQRMKNGTFLPEQEQCNEYLYEALRTAYMQNPDLTRTMTEAQIQSKARKDAKLTETMDDASPENLDKLLNATEAFLTSPQRYCRNPDATLQDAIAQFIEQNQGNLASTQPLVASSAIS